MREHERYEDFGLSIEGLPSFALDAERPLGRRFAAMGISDYVEAARHVRSLPYGRNADRSDWRLVLEEGRGTCSTKHALLAELARENGLPVSLMLGVYEMDGANTPGVGAVLEHHGLPFVPEAHCYLAHDGRRVDLTREGAGDGPEAFLQGEKRVGGFGSPEFACKIGMGSELGIAKSVKRCRNGSDRLLLGAEEARPRGLRLFSKRFLHALRCIRGTRKGRGIDAPALPREHLA